MKIIDRVGDRYGRLVVISQSKTKKKTKTARWLCICDCGKETIVDASMLSSGRTKSCGCLARELSSKRAKELFRKEKKLCSVEGCKNDISKGAHGLCGKHAQRFRRYGDVNYVTPESERRKRSRDAQLARFENVKGTTYRKNLGRHEHRVVAEKKIGRKLRDNEVVHHIDFNRHNNDPNNLQVMLRSEHSRLHSKNRSSKI